MRNPIARYTRWLHTQWPAGRTERYPEIRPDGTTAVPGLWVAGDLLGVPLLKFALDSGARTVRRIAESLGPVAGGGVPGVLDLVILGGGVAGMAAAMEARARGLEFEVIESSEPFSTLVNFPRAKPIFTYPRAMTPAGALRVTADVKEDLVRELETQAARAGIRPTIARAERVSRQGETLVVALAGGATRRARSVLVALGRSGDFRRLGVPGESLGKVLNRLHDPGAFAGQRALVVGGGDSALEIAIGLSDSGATVTLSHRGAEFARPKPELLRELIARTHPPSGGAGAATAARAAGSITVALGTLVREIREHEVVLARVGHDATPETIPNDVVFTMIGRDPALDFFRRSGVRIAGEWSPRRWLALGLYLGFCAWLYNWESNGPAWSWWQRRGWFPANLADLIAATGGRLAAQSHDPRTLIGTLAISAAGPSFYYTLAYCAVVVLFGFRRILRRRTPYVTAQTLTLMAVQVFPLFLIPEILLPLLGAHGLIPRPILDALFPVTSYGHGREYWRAYGFILAWPLNVYNIFTHEPLWAWIGIGIVQTLVMIPLGIYYFGKGFYCGWICSCGALAETLGDTHRAKMPHGPGWNRLNLAGQAVLGVAVALLIVRVVGWALGAGSWPDRIFDPGLSEGYKWTVDVFLAGVLGTGLYFSLSGRFWCRFLCPLAALMHVYARFSSFRILAEKDKCISCGQCTAECHQGIDVMSFANRGRAMQDPECVRCSACVHVCPTGVLTFGRVGRTGELIGIDRLAASPVQIREAEPRSAAGRATRSRGG